MFDIVVKPVSVLFLVSSLSDKPDNNTVPFCMASLRLTLVTSFFICLQSFDLQSIMMNNAYKRNQLVLILNSVFDDKYFIWLHKFQEHNKSSLNKIC